MADVPAATGVRSGCNRPRKRPARLDEFDLTTDPTEEAPRPQKRAKAGPSASDRPRKRTALHGDAAGSDEDTEEKARARKRARDNERTAAYRAIGKELHARASKAPNTIFKDCTGCGGKLDVIKFSVGTCKDGLHGTCKECMAAYHAGHDQKLKAIGKELHARALEAPDTIFKDCPGCGRKLDVIKFSLGTYKDGLQGTCKECMAADNAGRAEKLEAAC